MKQRIISQKTDNRPIGVFDSGVGGLTVVKELVKKLPFEDIVYYGDTAHAPYGIKSRRAIIRFSMENALFLLKQNVKMIVIACNTSSSVSLPSLRRNFKVPVLGVIGPGARDAVKASKKKRIGIIGTAATISSNAYKNEIARIDCSIKTFSQRCPLLVPVAEEPLMDEKIILDIIKYYLMPLKEKNIDTLVLGCTHYPLLKPAIAKFMSGAVKLVDSAESTALYAADSLRKQEAFNRNSRTGKLRFFVSDEIENFKRIGERFLNRTMDSIRKAGYGVQY